MAQQLDACEQGRYADRAKAEVLIRDLSREVTGLKEELCAAQKEAREWYVYS